jgi:hypothetical protein
MYFFCAEVPEYAKKTICAGRLRGFTNVSPQWRIEKLTQIFGLVGFGWYYDIESTWTEQGNNGVVMFFAKINLYVKNNGEWSKSIVGVGGSTLVAEEKNGMYNNDEALKMAVTDALSVACKQIGIGSAEYYDDSKYRHREEDEAKIKKSVDKPRECLYVTKEEKPKAKLEENKKESQITEADYIYPAMPSQLFSNALKSLDNLESWDEIQCFKAEMKNVLTEEEYKTIVHEISKLTSDVVIERNKARHKKTTSKDNLTTAKDEADKCVNISQLETVYKKHKEFLNGNDLNVFKYYVKDIKTAMESEKTEEKEM